VKKERGVASLNPLRWSPPFRAEDSGQSAIEFALTLPLILLVIAGVMVFGLAFNNYVMLTEATAVGARQLAISRGQTLDPCNTVYTAVTNAAPILNAGKMTFKISLNGNSYTGTSCSGTSTSGAPSNMVLGSTTVVTVTYPFSLGGFGKLLPSTYSLVGQTSELMQ
jgi:Flp pilus assembly protein TadG